MKTIGDDRASKWSVLRTIAVMLLAFGLSAAAAATVRALWKPVAGSDGNSRSRHGKLFAVHCANCHGPEGHGDGPAAAALKTRPPDFAAGWKHGATEEAIRHVITHGIPGTAMPAAGPSISGQPTSMPSSPSGRSLGDRRHSANPLAAELRKAGFVAEETPSAALEIDLRNATNGAAVTLDDFKGKTVLLSFWSTDCLPCLKELPHLEELSRRFAASDFAVVAVCVEEADFRRGSDRCGPSSGRRLDRVRGPERADPAPLRRPGHADQRADRSRGQGVWPADGGCGFVGAGASGSCGQEPETIVASESLSGQRPRQLHLPCVVALANHRRVLEASRLRCRVTGQNDMSDRLRPFFLARLHMGFLRLEAESSSEGFR